MLAMAGVVGESANEPEQEPGQPQGQDRAGTVQELAALRSRLSQLEAELGCSTTWPVESPIATASSIAVAAATAQTKEALRRAEEAERRVEEMQAKNLALEAKNSTLEALFRNEQDQRRRCHNLLLDMKGQVRVFCRIRPLLQTQDQGEEVATTRRDAFTVETLRAMTSFEGIPRSEKKPFQFDAVFGPSAQQDEVFREVHDLVQSAVDGYNVTVLAYGQTGAGKTHTMYGGEGEQRGVVPRTVELLFTVLERLDADRFCHTVRAHLVELYKQDLVDLLSVGRGAGKLEVRRDARTGDSSLDNVEEREVKSAAQLLQLLEEGTEHRHVASTQMNGDSSRSHLFLNVSLEVHDREAGTTISGKVRLCDLAGSERPKRSGAAGDTMREAIEINKALTALGDVIESLGRSTSRSLVPYRNHKLTQLLSDSLGGSAKTLMFVNVSPARSDVEETLNSLMYASRARCITNDVRGPHILAACQSSPWLCGSPQAAASRNQSPLGRPALAPSRQRRGVSKCAEDVDEDFARGRSPG